MQTDFSQIFSEHFTLTTANLLVGVLLTLQVGSAYHTLLTSESLSEYSAEEPEDEVLTERWQHKGTSSHLSSGAALIYLCLCPGLAALSLAISINASVIESTFQKHIY